MSHSGVIRIHPQFSGPNSRTWRKHGLEHVAAPPWRYWPNKMLWRHKDLKEHKDSCYWNQKWNPRFKFQVDFRLHTDLRVQADFFNGMPACCEGDLEDPRHRYEWCPSENRATISMQAVWGGCRRHRRIGQAEFTQRTRWTWNERRGEEVLLHK